jgi:hypothetical protein
VPELARLKGQLLRVRDLRGGEPSDYRGGPGGQRHGQRGGAAAAGRLAGRGLVEEGGKRLIE